MNLNTLDIYLGDEVLDVGSGPNPNPFATVLCDLYIDSDAQRSNNPLKTDNKPLVCASIEALPFRDKAFNFVSACHVLEHTDHPDKACKELMRVASRGYIETPCPWLEQGYWVATEGKSHWEYHKWYVWNPDQSVNAAYTREIGRKLIFERKDPLQFDGENRFGHTIRMMMEDIREHFSKGKTNNDRVNYIMAQFTPSLHATIFQWKDSFEVEVRE